MQSGQSLPRSVVKRYELMVVGAMGAIFIVLLLSLFSFGLGLYKKHHQMNRKDPYIFPIKSDLTQSIIIHHSFQKR